MLVFVGVMVWKRNFLSTMGILGVQFANPYSCQIVVASWHSSKHILPNKTYLSLNPHKHPTEIHGVLIFFWGLATEKKPTRGVFFNFPISDALQLAQGIGHIAQVLREQRILVATRPNHHPIGKMINPGGPLIINPGTLKNRIIQGG